MTSADWRSAPAPRVMTGDEAIRGTVDQVRNFWAWSLSDLRTNTVRSLLAEFLVARAVGAAKTPRVEWDTCDVRTIEGIRLEVKSGAYLQAWQQSRLSTIVFAGLRARTWSADEGYAEHQSYNADVYVFAVLMATDHERYDALDVEQWSFWVLPQDVVAGTGQRSMRLSRVEALAGAPVAYSGLAERIRAVAGPGQTDERSEALPS